MDEFECECTDVCVSLSCVCVSGVRVESKCVKDSSLPLVSKTPKGIDYDFTLMES